MPSRILGSGFVSCIAGILRSPISPVASISTTCLCRFFRSFWFHLTGLQQPRALPFFMFGYASQPALLPTRSTAAPSGRHLKRFARSHFLTVLSSTSAVRSVAKHPTSTACRRLATNGRESRRVLALQSHTEIRKSGPGVRAVPVAGMGLVSDGQPLPSAGGNDGADVTNTIRSIASFSLFLGDCYDKRGKASARSL